MRYVSRIKAIYTKELVELLRDRRTLIAMIVVPIALYPLLIIGSVHLLTVRDGERMFEKIVVGVPRERDRSGRPSPKEQLEGLLTHATQVVALQDDDSDSSDGGRGGGVDERIRSIQRIAVEEFDDVKSAVAAGLCQVGVTVEFGDTNADQPQQIVVELFYDKAEMSSEAALGRIEEAIELVSDAQKKSNMAVMRIPLAAIEPIRIETANVASPKKVGGMVLGSIVPLVLVLMTITGAIYPAIDLTAGERERGTLETLIVAPVPPMALITGKYLVVTTVAMMGAALNLVSMGLTLYIGGFADMIGSGGDTELPLAVLPVILLALVPFALLFSAVMVAVCSYARTFKEAQNYIMPVILAALIPGGIAALPGTQLEGVKAVIPVMNMVLMARELLLGHYEWSKIALVMLSTSFYAAIAVVIASRVFSTEAVVFADSASLRSVFVRRLMRPAERPSVSLALIVTALLFPTWMFVQFSSQPGEGESVLHTFIETARWLPVFFVLLPVCIVAYFKVNVRRTFGLSVPKLRFVVAAVLIGSVAWIPAHELFVLQSMVWHVPQVILDSDEQMRTVFTQQPLWFVLLLIAVVPAICEELFFRGFVLSGVGTAARKWPAIIVAACVFGVFHFLLIKFALTAGLGLLLGYLCWQSGSILPAIVAHVLHNASAILLVMKPAYGSALGISDREPLAHLPAYLIAIAIVTLAAGVAMCHNWGGNTRNAQPATDRS